jgi:hypothetical protein
VSLPSGFTIKMLYEFVISIRVTLSVYPIILDLITVISTIW